MRRRLSIVAGVLLVAGALVALPALPAEAVACTSPVRYATSTNTIYLVTTQSFTLTSIKTACPGAPIELVDPVNKVWELDADLILQNGSSLVLHGAAATSPGDVDT